MMHQCPIREDMFEAHRYLCRRGARKFVRRGLDSTDLEQVAAIGLIKACRRYDASTETPFEAFAWLMILGELMHHVRDFEHVVRLPRWVRALERRYADGTERLTQRLGREPSDGEVAAEMRVPRQAVCELRRAQGSRVHEHLDAAFGYESHVRDPLDRLLAESALAAVEPAARAIVLGIYALGLSRNEVARRVGMTVREVTRAHDSALARMRLALHLC
jgi:RNA polymerase sigma-B factor